MLGRAGFSGYSDKYHDIELRKQILKLASAQPPKMQDAANLINALHGVSIVDRLLLLWIRDHRSKTILIRVLTVPERFK